MGIQDKSEPREVTAAVATDLRIYAGRRWPTMNHKWRKARLASLLGMNERRVKSIYEAEETARLRADEEARIKALISAEEERADAEADNALARRIAELEAQVAFLVTAMAGEALAGSRVEKHGSSERAAGRVQSAPRRRSADNH